MNRLEVTKLKVLDEIVVLRIKRNRKNKRFSLVFISFKIVRKSLQFDLELIGLNYYLKHKMSTLVKLKINLSNRFSWMLMVLIFSKFKFKNRTHQFNGLG